MNTWPENHRRALTQSEHAKWNAKHYPGTRQTCLKCDDVTGRCEEDSIFHDETGPLCEKRAEEILEGKR